MKDIHSDIKVYKFANYMAFAILICIAIIVFSLLVSNRNVGTIDGGLLYYNGEPSELG